MIIEASFVRSAASASDFPREGLAEIALVGRSNVGKSSLINALVRQRVARTSAAPGKTRLANVYRVARGGFEPFYLVDLPGYGYARAPRQARGGLSGAEGRRQAACEFETLTAAYFARAREDRPERQDATPARPAPPDHPACVSALLLVDARHPGLASDLAAWQWIRTSVDRTGIAASKIDKLSRAERLRAVKANEAAFEHPVLPVSASTGEGLDELWKLIEHLATPSRNNPRHRRPPLPHRKS